MNQLVKSYQCRLAPPMEPRGRYNATPLSRPDILSLLFCADVYSAVTVYYLDGFVSGFHAAVILSRWVRGSCPE
jgi:hypothetical protein